MDLRDLRPPAGGVLVVPMSRAEFEALPAIPHAEWWDGACVVSSTTNRHGRVVVSLGSLLRQAVAGQELYVGAGTGWRLPDAEFGPDLLITGPAPDDELLTIAPLLIVEVLSPSTRHIDLGRKRELYAAGGVEWYWIVDLSRDRLIVYRNIDGELEQVQQISSGTSAGPVAIEVTVATL
jgi:Uma2 family endonuclease